MQNWQINPTTGDYVMSGGAPVQTNSLQEPSYYRLKIKRSTWLYAPDKDYGSDYYKIVKRPLNNSNSLLENIGTAALQPIIDDGRAKSATLTVVQNARNGTALECQIVDASNQVETLTFTGLGF